MLPFGGVRSHPSSAEHSPTASSFTQGKSHSPVLTRRVLHWLPHSSFPLELLSWSQGFPLLVPRHFSLSQGPLPEPLLPQGPSCPSSRSVCKRHPSPLLPHPVTCPDPIIRPTAQNHPTG